MSSARLSAESTRSSAISSRAFMAGTLSRRGRSSHSLRQPLPSQPLDVRAQRLEIAGPQVLLVARHAQAGTAQELACDGVALQPARHAALDPFFELGARLHQLAEVRAIPRRDIALERARVRARQPAPGSMTAHAAERLDSLQPLAGERIRRLLHAGDRGD